MSGCAEVKIELIDWRKGWVSFAASSPGWGSGFGARVECNCALGGMLVPLADLEPNEPQKHEAGLSMLSYC